MPLLNELHARFACDYSAGHSLSRKSCGNRRMGAIVALAFKRHETDSLFRNVSQILTAQLVID